MTKADWFQTLLREYEGRLLRYAKRWVSHEVASDLVQESFLRLWRENQSTLAGREPEWLFCVCRNLALDVLKKEKPMSEPSESLAADTESAEAEMGRRQEENKVFELIGKLPKSQQEVVRLKFQEGFSYKEISSITGHSVSHVGVLIHEAMTKLRTVLAQSQASHGLNPVSSQHGGRK